MQGRGILTVLICIVFVAAPGVWAEGQWRLDTVGDFNVAFCRKADSSGLAIYFVPSGAVWLCVRMPQGAGTINLSRPFEVRVDQGETFSNAKTFLQPDRTVVAWELVAEGSPVVAGSLLDRLTNGTRVHVRCHVDSGREFEMTVPLDGAGASIRRLLSMRP